MLFRHLSAALAGSLLVIGVVADHAVGTALKKRVVPRSHTVHERQPEHWADKWEKRDKVPADVLLPMRIGLKQLNLVEGHNKLSDISNPFSANYGKHMSAEEVIDFFAPEQSRVDLIVNWLTEAGIAADRVSLSANKQWVQFDATTSEMEDILYTDFYVYKHSQSGSAGIACDQYHIPAHVTEHVDYITPGIRLRQESGKAAKLRRRSTSQNSKRGTVAYHTDLIGIPESVKIAAHADDDTNPFNSSMCATYVSQVCIRNQYRIPKGSLAYPGNELGIFESLNDHVWTEDLDHYWAVLYQDIPQGTYPTEKLIDGAIGFAQSTSEIGIESALDFEAAMPLIYPQGAILFQTDDEYYELSQSSTIDYPGFWNTFYDAIDGSYCTYSAYNETGDCTDAACRDPSYPDPYGYSGQLMCGVYEPTNVISISYGGGESDFPAYYLERQCSEIMKLGLQGVTVVISSGDYGVGGFPSDGSTSGCQGTDGTIFFPQDDATCPYVLAVGSTEFDTPDTPSCKWKEIATTEFPSGGGFSNVFPTADYQVSAVQQYFATANLSFTGYSNFTNFSSVTSGVYNINGRGYPDVSAIGQDFVVAYDSDLYLVGGTSLSAPVWASIITRINEERLAVGKGTVGFINPTLYANPQVLNDITEGSNPNCGSTGFIATVGWDPVTGLGAPNYPKLLSLFMSLP
ncbi:subtilisin-like protein [Coniochaeta ligniaria NRRL 30616]|uniref:Subtilisin-like protein n=1 Tax=Coniochaeta ligniaria NRRL 30616 TaxID=1408157 RepID=A0A1J7JVX8_9PEZI|nr:subtilisin-like protein [Coniochaeta ligniaria NRRL 30616]